MEVGLRSQVAIVAYCAARIADQGMLCTKRLGQSAHNSESSSRDCCFPQDRLQRTALHWATEQGHQECVAALMDFGIDVNAVDSVGRCVEPTCGS